MKFEYDGPSKFFAGFWRWRRENGKVWAFSLKGHQENAFAAFWRQWNGGRR